MSSELNLTNKELLWRIDERVSQLQRQLNKICVKIDEMEERVNNLEDFKKYFLGIVGVIGAAVGLIGDKLVDLLFK
jgi:hypothetical protein